LHSCWSYSQSFSTPWSSLSEDDQCLCIIWHVIGKTFKRHYWIPASRCFLIEPR
jgi:hypothetical protein